MKTKSIAAALLVGLLLSSFPSFANPWDEGRIDAMMERRRAEDTAKQQVVYPPTPAEIEERAIQKRAEAEKIKATLAQVDVLEHAYGRQWFRSKDAQEPRQYLDAYLSIKRPWKLDPAEAAFWIIPHMAFDRGRDEALLNVLFADTDKFEAAAVAIIRSRLVGWNGFKQVMFGYGAPTIYQVLDAKQKRWLTLSLLKIEPNPRIAAGIVQSLGQPIEMRELVRNLPYQNAEEIRAGQNGKQVYRSRYGSFINTCSLLLSRG